MTEKMEQRILVEEDEIKRTSFFGRFDCFTGGGVGGKVEGVLWLCERR